MRGARSCKENRILLIAERVLDLGITISRRLSQDSQHAVSAPLEGRVGHMSIHVFMPPNTISEHESTRRSHQHRSVNFLAISVQSAIVNHRLELVSLTDSDSGWTHVFGPWPPPPEQLTGVPETGV